jgi:hypothetical protein
MKWPKEARKEELRPPCGQPREYIAIPRHPRYPKLRKDAMFRPLHAPPGYVSVDQVAKYDLTIAETSTTQECAATGCFFAVKVQVSNIGKSSSQPSLVLLAIIPRGVLSAFGRWIPIESIGAGQSRTVETKIGSPDGKRVEDFSTYAEIHLQPDVEESQDANVSNDTLGCPEAKGGAICRRSLGI